MSSPRYSLSAIRASLPAEKNRADSVWTRIILRPLSIPVAWLAIRLGISANGVSYISAVTALAGGALLATGRNVPMLIGAVFLNIFAVMDCADGNIARVTGTSGPWGGWADALSGYSAYLAALLGAGMAAEAMAGSALPGLAGYVLPLKEGAWAFLGGLAAATNQLMRLAYMSYKTVRRSEAAKDIVREKWISENLGITGLLMPAILVGVLTGYLPWVVEFYAVFYTAGCAFSVVKLARNVERIRRGEKL